MDTDEELELAEMEREALKQQGNKKKPNSIPTTPQPVAKIITTVPAKENAATPNIINNTIKTTEIVSKNKKLSKFFGYIKPLP